jgi:ubiquinone/menaquinone biosynthesis C-methylase UbiE
MKNICGSELIDRAVACCRFEENARLADIGCGNGEAARYLRLKWGFDVTGVDKKNGVDAAALPFCDESLDGVFFKCSFSVMENPTLALRETRRVLKPGGCLVIDDFYAQKKEKNFLSASDMLGRVERRETIMGRLRQAGFSLSLFEDYTGTMRRELAQAIFEDGTGALFREARSHKEALKEAQCGYALFILNSLAV